MQVEIAIVLESPCDRPETPAVPPKISAFPKCYLDRIAGERSMSVFDWIEQARALDADGLEMYEGFFESLDDDYIDRVGEAIAAAGFAMPMLCCSPDFTHPDLAARMGGRRAPGGDDPRHPPARGRGGRLPGPLRPAIPGPERLRGARPGRPLHRGVAGPSPARPGVVLGLENHYKDGFWTYPEFAQKREVFLALLDAIPDRTHFGVQFDPSNALVAGDDPVALLEAVADRVVSMHASDRYLAEGATLDSLRQSDGTLGYSPDLRHGVTGKGLNDYDAIFRILADHDYRGWISIEDGMNGMDEMAESLAFLRRMVAEYFVEPGGLPDLTGTDRHDGPPDRPGRLRQGRLDPRPGPARRCPSPTSSPPATPSLDRAEDFAAPMRRAALRRPRRDAGRGPARGRPPGHAAPAPRRGRDPGRRGRRPRPGREAAGRDPRDADAMLAAARKAGVTLGVISQRRFYEPVLRIKAAIDAGKIGRPALGVFPMFSWRDPAYYASDPWRGRWDAEGGGVLVNQSPHQLDLLRWFLGDVEEVSGTWANLNHPEVEVDDTAVATLRFRNGGLGSIVTSLSQKPGLYTKVHVHGTNGASVGVETDRGATFIAGRLRDRRAPAQRPLDHPRRGAPPGRVPGRGPRPVRRRSTPPTTTTPCRSGTSSGRSSKAARPWSPARTAARSSPCSPRSTDRTAKGRPIRFPLRAEDGDGRPCPSN